MQYLRSSSSNNHQEQATTITLSYRRLLCENCFCVRQHNAKHFILPLARVDDVERRWKENGHQKDCSEHSSDWKYYFSLVDESESLGKKSRRIIRKMLLKDIRQRQRRRRPSLPLVTPPQKHSPIMMWSEGPALSSLVQLSLKNSCHRNSKTIDVSMLNKKMKRRLIHNICLSSGIPSRIGFYHLIVMDHCHLNRAYYLLLHADFPFVRQ